MKAAGKVMVVTAVVLALGMVAASDLSAASKSDRTAPSTNGAVWGGTGGGGLLTQPVNRGQQHVSTQNQDRGCFAGTASENARCIANKVINLFESATWGGGGTFGLPPK